jgi:hypothetical protein
MRSFIGSALLIIGLLIGQQWMVKSAVANPNAHKYEQVTLERGVVKDTGFAQWAAADGIELNRGVVQDTGFADWLDATTPCRPARACALGGRH